MSAGHCHVPLLDVPAAKLHHTLLYDSNIVVVALSVLDLDCTKSISFPVFSVIPFVKSIQLDSVSLTQSNPIQLSNC